MKNNWYVITGAPCSGKTTLLQELEKKGYKVFYEWARIYIDQEIKKGKTLAQIRKNELDFQRKILQLKVAFEKKLNKKNLVFMERGIPDSTAYFDLITKKNILLKKSLKKSYYKKIFLLELLDYQIDYARTESHEQAKSLENLLEKSYVELGLEVVRIPKMPLKKRTKLLLSYVKE
ncbi:MAG: ATP-binding protein [Candidatus Roizmanbacteria bacterium]|nr:MAG: ATP-binding protein [Candidatus Roizmanbacteria bacterium]